MEEIIRNFPKQFAWDPKIENEGKLSRLGKYILAGMGGSHLQGDILNTVAPESNVFLHKDYGLPAFTKEDLSQYLLVASSYSGNTEETISAFKDAIQRRMGVAAISTGGQLLELAQSHKVPYIQIPDTGIQPRMALGFGFRALVKMIGSEDLVESSGKLAFELKAEEFEEQGRTLAKKLEKRVPVVYSSQKNYAAAYIWKVKLNEGAKVPAFFNVFPELNHNELAGFSTKGATGSHVLHFLFLKDSNDHPRIQKRMEVTERLYKAMGLEVSLLQLEGRTILHKVFSSLLIADWAAYDLALKYGADPEQTPIIEEFKKLMS